MKKKSILARIGFLAVILTLATTSLMSGTLAKYQTNQSISGTAIIAKWSPTATVDVQITDGSFKLADTVANKYLILTEGGQIAPGMGGTIPVQVALGESEVGLDYKIEFCAVMDGQLTSEPALAHIKFTVNGTETPLSELQTYTPTEFNAFAKDGKTAVENAPMEEIGSGTLSPVATSGGSSYPKEASADIVWNWDYESADDLNYDIQDTALGEYQTTEALVRNITFYIRVSMTQVDPTVNPNAGTT